MMKAQILYQIKDKNGNIVDRGLTYEEALMWTDQSFGNRYTMCPMKEGDQNNCSSL